MNKFEIYLIRHGKTIANEKKLYCGKTDLSLSDLGKKELKELNIKYPKCDLYFTSGAKRANETLKILFGNVDYIKLLDFFEYNFGDFEMKSYEELKENKLYIDWILDKEGKVSCPNGESKEVYKNRIKKEFIRFLNEANNSNIEKVALVCHGGTIGTILEEFYDNSKSFYEHQPSCGEGYKLIINKTNETLKIINVEEIKSNRKQDKNI